MSDELCPTNFSLSRTLICPIARGQIVDKLKFVGHSYSSDLLLIIHCIQQFLSSLRIDVL